MKKLKRLLVIFLSIAMVMCSTLPNFASENDAASETIDTVGAFLASPDETTDEETTDEETTYTVGASTESLDETADEETTDEETIDTVGASIASPEETTDEETTDTVGAKLASPSEIIDEETIVEEIEEEPEEETTDTVGAKLASPSEINAEETIAEEINKIEIIATASNTKILNLPPPSATTWMYWWTTDSGKTIHFSSPNYANKPANAVEVADEAPNSYDAEGLDRSIIESAKFEDAINAKTCEGLFSNFTNLTAINNLDRLNTEAVEDMSSMFANCMSLVGINLKGLKTSNVKYMNSMFENCESASSIELNDDLNFDTSNVVNMKSMFNACIALTSLDLRRFDTAKVTDMESMFDGCNLLQRIYASEYFKTDAVTSSENMFRDCTSIQGEDATTYEPTHINKEYARIDGLNSLRGYFSKGPWMYWYLSDGDTTIHFTRTKGSTTPIYEIFGSGLINYGSLVRENIIYAEFDNEIEAVTCQGLFFNFRGLKGIKDLKNLKTHKVTNMSQMFHSCVELENIDLSYFNTSKVENVTGMFEYCYKLKSLDFSNFNTDNVRTMDFMFISCSSLTSLNLYKFKTENVTDMDSMFYRCSELTYINLSNFNTLNVTNMDTMFGSCGKLETIVVGATFTTGSVTTSDNMFKECTSLVGASGTRCDGINHINKEYARIDGVEPGYFTGIRIETISINSKPITTTYFVGKHIDPSGLKINLNYSDGAVVVVEYVSGNAGDFTFNPSLSANLGVMNRSVTVTYSGRSTSFGIDVIYSGSGNSSGSSAGGSMPADGVPTTTSVNMIKIVKGTLSRLTSEWELRPTDGGWGLNTTDANGNVIPVTNGFYILTYVNTQIVNGIPIQTESNNTYYFDEKGKMVTGWIRTSDGKCYFFENEKTNEEGKMVIGWKQIQGAWHYFGADGAMYVNTITPDGYRVGADGKWIG